MRPTSNEIGRLYEILRRMDYFVMFTLGQLEDFILMAEKENCRKGYKIIRQGEEGDFFCVIDKGWVSVWAAEKGLGKSKVKELGPGSYFGEAALVDDKPRNATVIAEEPCEYFIFYRNDFLDLLDQNPEVKARFQKVAVRRSMERKRALQKPRPSFFRRLFGLD